MADTTGKHTPDTDPKAGEPAAAKSGPVKSGPVKPPVLEGTAKSAAGSKPADSTKSATSGSSATSGKPASATATKPAAPAPGGSGSGSVWIAGLVGGALGLGAAYGLAWYGLWPAPEQTPPPADPRLAQFATAIPELETVASTVQDELSTLTRRVGALETSQAEQSGGTLDLSGLASAEDLAALSTRLDELASRSSPESGSPESLTAIEAELAALRTSAAETSVQLAQAREDVAALTEMTSETAGDGLNAARLPLIFSSLESAFDAGRPYETELAALRQARPDYLVPEAVAGAAASGLPQPNLIANRLDAVLPDMLAGRPADTEASWQDAGLDWFRGLVAMRPTGAVEGDSPDAIIARLEAAVAARDFSAAQAELNALPRPMHDAAGGLVEDIARLAAAEEFLAQLRETALTGEAGA